MDAIQIIKVQGGTLEESFLDEGEQACHRKDVSKLFFHLFINIAMSIFLYSFNYFVIIKYHFAFYPQRVRKTIKGSDKSSFISRFYIDLDLLTNFQCHCTNQNVTLLLH